MPISIYDIPYDIPYLLFQVRLVVYAGTLFGMHQSVGGPWWFVSPGK